MANTCDGSPHCTIPGCRAHCQETGRDAPPGNLTQGQYLIKCSWQLSTTHAACADVHVANETHNTRAKDPGVLRHIVLDFKQMKDWIQEPLILERADGVRYWDVDGKCYLDGLSGIFVVNVGARIVR